MENPSNIVPDQLIVLEGDAGLVPKASSGDVGKVLGVLNSSGDVGWVPDQEGMAQVQSDWDQTDSSQVSYIANKPDLSVYATTSDMNTALSGKQDTISDLADIRAGAAKGDTAVQPAALDNYATTSAMNTALAGKQNVISDLSDIRAGAALGATAVQPSQLPSSDELVPSATSGDSGKVLTVDAQGDPAWITPAGGSDVTTANGSFRLGGSVPVKVNYTGSQEYERGSLQLVNTFSDGTYAVAVFEVVGAHSIYYETYGDATVTISEAMDIAGTGNSDFAISFLQSDSYWNMDGQIYRDSFTRTDGKIVAQSLRFWSISQYSTGPYLGVGVKVTNDPNESEKIDAVVQQLANGAVSISDWPSEQITVTTIPNIPASTSADANKVLTVDSNGDAGWQNPATVTVDQHYNASSTNPQSGTAVAEALGSTSTLASGDGISLTESAGTLTVAADVDNVTIGFDSTTHKIKSLQSVPSVDQTYDSASTNAQSGTAVAQAIAAIPSSSYTAGVGIDITSDVISADIDGVTIKQATTQSTLQSVYDIERSPSSGYGVIQLDSEVSSKFTMDPEVRPQMITIHIPGNTFRRLGSGDVTSSTNVYPEIGDATQEFGTESHASLYPTPLEIVYNSTDGYTYIAEQDVVVSRFMGYWVNRNSMDPARGGKYYFGFAESQTPQVSNQLYVTANGSDSIVSPVVMSETVTSNQIAVAVPVPAFSQADSGKVLKVNASGNAEWGTDGFTTTAGITDIQKVNALPANPVATVLYLIPET